MADIVGGRDRTRRSAANRLGPVEHRQVVGVAHPVGPGEGDAPAGDVDRLLRVSEQLVEMRDLAEDSGLEVGCADRSRPVDTGRELTEPDLDVSPRDDRAAQRTDHPAVEDDGGVLALVGVVECEGLAPVVSIRPGDPSAQHLEQVVSRPRTRRFDPGVQRLGPVIHRLTRPVAGVQEGRSHRLPPSGVRLDLRDGQRLECPVAGLEHVVPDREHEGSVEAEVVVDAAGRVRPLMHDAEIVDVVSEHRDDRVAAGCAECAVGGFEGVEVVVEVSVAGRGGVGEEGVGGELADGFEDPVAQAGVVADDLDE